MKIIEKVIGDSHIGEVSTVAQAICGVSDNYDWSNDPYLSATVDTLKVEEDNLTVAINRDKAISVLDSKDKERSAAVRSVFYLNRGYLYHPSAEVLEAATFIGSILNKYGIKIASTNRPTETSLVDSLLVDLSTDESVAALAKLSGMGENIANLTTTQADFVKSYTSFEEAKAKEGTYDNASTIKKVVVKIINDELVVYLRAMRIASPDTYESFASAVAQIIDDSNVIVRKRRNKGSK